MNCMSSKFSDIHELNFRRGHSRQLELRWSGTDRKQVIGLPYCGQLKDANLPVLRLSTLAPYRWRGRNTNPSMQRSLGTDAPWYSRRDLLGVLTCIEGGQMQCLADIVVALATCPAGTLASRGHAIDATSRGRHAPTVLSLIHI